MSYLSQQANNRGVELTELAITPAQLAAVIGLVADGSLNNKLAAWWWTASWPATANPRRSSRGAGSSWSPTTPRCTPPWTRPSPPAEVAEKIRGGKVAAAGAIVGAVMKATKGQADAQRVRELVLERCT